VRKKSAFLYHPKSLALGITWHYCQVMPSYVAILLSHAKWLLLPSHSKKNSAMTGFWDLAGRNVAQLQLLDSLEKQI
jgi:hypothetical protein